MAMVAYPEENPESCANMVTNMMAHKDGYLWEAGLEDDMAGMDMNAYTVQVLWIQSVPGSPMLGAPGDGFVHLHRHRSCFLCKSIGHLSSLMVFVSILALLWFCVGLLFHCRC